MAIRNTMKEYVKLLTKNDAVIVRGGTRGVGRNESTNGLKQLKDFYMKNNQTNIIQICVPHRFDLSANAHVNKEVEAFNRKLGKLVKPFEHTTLIKLDLNRELFTKHGLHMNDKGKECYQEDNLYYKAHSM
jgi:glutathionyl-hydroquinone reductase